MIRVSQFTRTRSLKSVDLHVRPIYHHLDDRVRAHIFLCMLAYYVEWHMRQRLAPLLFDDEHKEEMAGKKASVVAPAICSPSASSKARNKRTKDGLPVSSFQTLLKLLSSLCRNTIAFKMPGSDSFYRNTEPTALQAKAFELLENKLAVHDHPCINIYEQIKFIAMQEDDAYYMRMAIQQASIADANNEVPVGALLVMQDGWKVAAHNAPISLNDASAHAEMCAIRAACKALGNYRLPGSTLYVTLEPCIMCAGAILHARIARVVYGTRDRKAGAVESLYQILSDSRLNHQPEIVGGVLHTECSKMLHNFFRQRRNLT